MKHLLGMALGINLPSVARRLTRTRLVPVNQKRIHQRHVAGLANQMTDLRTETSQILLGEADWFIGRFGIEASKWKFRLTSHRKIPCRGTVALGSNKNPAAFLFLAILSHPQSDDE